MGSERSTDRGEGKPLKGEAQGRSGTLVVSGGPVVEVAQGVAKPRTRHAVAKGFAAGKRIRRFETVSKGSESPGEEVSSGEPGNRRDGTGSR